MEQGNLIEALKQISIALKNIEWESRCNRLASDTDKQTYDAIKRLDEIIKTEEK
ncbi:MAG TPA: hypothetical protein PLY25_09670 [Bacteroidia bacterium]|nr:hypothetical protein [Bacteroidia bacterium]